jgi:hypothetical protein
MKQKLMVRPASSSRLPAKVTYWMSFRRLTKAGMSEGSLMRMCRKFDATHGHFVRENY